MKLLERRIILAILAFIVTLNLDFFLPRLVPGSAADIFASRSYLPAREVQIISARLGLNQPLPTQYLLYLKGIFLSWPPYFGVSYQYYPEPVTTLVASRIPWTMLLIITSLVLSTMISFLLAGINSMRRQSKAEISTMYTSIMFWSIPTFWVGMVLIWVFAVTLGWFPVFGNSSFQAGTGLAYIGNVLWHAVLPIATLTLATFAQGYVVLRGATQEALKADYVIAAKCRGLKQNVVAFGYILRNSLLPVVSLLGYSLAGLISFAIVIEAVFGYQGVGDLFVDGLYNRDYPVLEGSFFFTTLLVILGGILADYLITRLDPRVR
jgi:peptide/nickel transport system permease protein